MNKKFLASIITAALLVGGSTYTYTTFASEANYSSNVAEKSTLENTEIQEDHNVTIKPISTVPNDQIHIPLDLANPSVIEKYSADITDDNPISELLGSYTTDYGDDSIEVSANYILESGSAVDFIQVPLNITPEEAVDFYTSGVYSDAEITTGEVNGYKVVYVKGEASKAIHMMSERHAYTINTVFDDVSIEYLEELAKLITE
ncbi:hypothetical protein [Paenibacillus sp. Marseille-Q7038]